MRMSRSAKKLCSVDDKYENMHRHSPYVVVVVVVMVVVVVVMVVVVVSNQ